MASLAARAASVLTPAEHRTRVDAMPVRDLGHGVDEFGLAREWVALGVGLTRGLYDTWFRVDSEGHEHIPAKGGAIIAANHSGTLPFDAAMMWADVARRSQPPRVVRMVADHFVPNLPFVSKLVARLGGVGGSRQNLSRLLERGELVGVFPEGTPGIGKHFRERYQLKPWRVGHCELAMQHRVPVIPAAIIGAEEQMPQIARIPVGSRLFGAPYLPVSLTPFPLPVHYHILYGSPIVLHEVLDVSRRGHPEIQEQAAAMVSGAVRELLDRGLSLRKGVFR